MYLRVLSGNSSNHSSVRCRVEPLRLVPSDSMIRGAASSMIIGLSLARRSLILPLRSPCRLVDLNNLLLAGTELVEGPTVELEPCIASLRRRLTTTLPMSLVNRAVTHRQGSDG